VEKVTTALSPEPTKDDNPAEQDANDDIYRPDYNSRIVAGLAEEDPIKVVLSPERRRSEMCRRLGNQLKKTIAMSARISRSPSSFGSERQQVA